MNQLAQDELTGRRVLIAEHRADRPNEFASRAGTRLEDASPRSDCPFCPGNEAGTPDALAEIAGPIGEWQVRVVPNKYPAVETFAGQGLHEVIIESRRHLERTGQLSTAELGVVLETYAQRLAVAGEEDRFPYQLLFKNVGPSAGASLGHLHSQLLALRSAPPHVELEQARLAAHRLETGRCGWCDRIDSDLQDQRRVVASGDGWLAVCPAASRQPYETWIFPTQHQHSFAELATAPDAIGKLANLLHSVVRAIETLIDGAGYNLMIHTTHDPPDASHPRGDGHWRMEIVPRVASLAGLELATGLFVNVLPTERAAERLRRQIERQPAQTSSS